MKYVLRSSLALALLIGPATASAQEVPTLSVDSIAVEGNSRLTAAQITGTAALVLGQPVNYRDIQRAIVNLVQTGQFDDVYVEQREVGGKLVLAFVVRERPILESLTISGNERLRTRTLRERIHVREGRPIDRAGLTQAIASIDSLYIDRGYYTARVEKEETMVGPASIRVVLRVREGERVAISQVIVDGNERFSDKDIVKKMSTRPEGFWWFQRGEFDELKLERDIRERLPRFYANNGMVDFRVVSDTLVPDRGTGKAVLSLTVEEGETYNVGTIAISGNRRFSAAEVARYFPFGGVEALGSPERAPPEADVPFDRSAWDEATENLRTLYANNGYIYAQVTPIETRRETPTGPKLDLRWNIQEGSPATINKIIIVGNDVTHEGVIRSAITMVPGQLFSRDALINSYRSIENLGFFQTPSPPPDVQPINGRGPDVDVIFRVEERRTGNINFGASLGQGIGLGGFLGLEEPNLFGRGKRGRLQWQFGRNINDFTLSYTDPAIRESRISGTITLFDSRARYTISDLGRRQATGGSLQVGFPFLGSRYTRIFASYGLQRIKFTEGSQDLRARFSCARCTRSTLGLSIVRDTRIGLPFPVGGMQVTGRFELNGGLLGGTGDYRKAEFEGRWYAPVGLLGGNGDFGGGVALVLGLTARSGFIFGDAGPFFTELYSMGGTQFGTPLRGYEEFSITPNGFDPLAGGSRANPDAFGESYASFTAEFGARISQSLYLNTFLDAGNVYRTPAQWNPTSLFRGAGVGASLLSPLGPIGIDLAYGFDRVDRFGAPDPGWKIHFKLGNFF